MSLPTKQKTIIQEEGEEKNDLFQDKRRLLSYWRSLESPTDPDQELDEIDKDDLLKELERSLAEMNECVSHVVNIEKETNYLQSEQLSLLKHVGDYVHQFIKEKSLLDLNENLKNEKDKDYQKNFDALKEEKSLILKENERLVKQLKTQSEEYKLFSKEQQRDIEKLTREVQNFNISRMKLERELVRVTKLKEENDTTIHSLRHELQTVKEKHDTDVEKLSSMNEKVSKDNSELVEKGKEATESLKVALQQLTEEKNAMQEQKKSGKSTLDLEMSLERAKKERETFRQRCEKSEMLQRNLQQEVTSLENELKEKEEKIKSLLHKNETSSKQKVIEGSNSVDEVEETNVQSRILQLKNYANVLEDRVKEREESVLSLRKESAHANDLVMEKSLELSRTRRILERKIERLAKENSELKRKFLNPNNYAKSREVENEQLDPGVVQINRLQQGRASEGDIEKTKRFRMENTDRRKSNPERSCIQTTLRRFDKDDGTVEQQHTLPNNKADDTTNGNLPVDRYLTKSEQSSILRPVEVRSIEVVPRRRTGGKFIRASSKRHSADLGKLMSRQQSAAARKSESDLLHKEEPATIFVNKHRKSEEEHWV